jgi:hypothetical protein
VAQESDDQPRVHPLLSKDTPDWALVTDDETCEILRVSRDTLFRLDKAGLGPAVTRLSARRKARTIGAIRSFIAARTSS